jgi:hypothetical protein
MRILPLAFGLKEKVTNHWGRREKLLRKVNYKHVYKFCMKRWL